jgi:hypothetical protein
MPSKHQTVHVHEISSRDIRFEYSFFFLALFGLVCVYLLLLLTRKFCIRWGFIVNHTEKEKLRTRILHLESELRASHGREQQLQVLLDKRIVEMKRVSAANLSYLEELKRDDPIYHDVHFHHNSHCKHHASRKSQNSRTSRYSDSHSHHCETDD